MMELIGFPPSPFVRKVRIALLEKGLQFTLKDEAPWEHTTKTGLYNPLQKVPVLILPPADGATAGEPSSANTTAIYESRFILEYLELKFPDAPPLVSRDDADARLRARQIEVVADGVGAAMQLRHFELLRDAGARSAPWLARQERKIDGGLRAMQEWVLEPQGGGVEREFLVGGAFGLADVAAGAICGFFDQMLPEYGLRERFPALWRYSRRLEQRASFKASVPAEGMMRDKVV